MLSRSVLPWGVTRTHSVEYQYTACAKSCQALSLGSTGAGDVCLSPRVLCLFFLCTAAVPCRGSPYPTYSALQDRDLVLLYSCSTGSHVVTLPFAVFLLSLLLWFVFVCVAFCSMSVARAHGTIARAIITFLRVFNKHVPCTLQYLKKN